MENAIMTLAHAISSAKFCEAGKTENIKIKLKYIHSYFFLYNIIYFIFTQHPTHCFNTDILKSFH